jgi:predicted nucleotidyltransferase
MAHGLSDAWVQKLRVWAAQKSEIREVWIFGSRAHGDHRADSDIDIAVGIVGDKERRFNIWYWTFPEWKEELQKLLPIKADLRLLDAEIPEDDKVIPAVRSEGIDVFRREEERVN